MSHKAYWERQSSSQHRADLCEFYASKAAEHASVMRVADRSAGALDLGCGAGELLEHLLPLVHLDAGLDYAASMLDAASNRLGEAVPLLEEADVFEYLENAESPVWMTTGALNQYLDAAQLRKLIQLFAESDRAQSFYLFDCVDPLRYRLMDVGISYRPTQLVVPSLSQILKQPLINLRAAIGVLFSSPLSSALVSLGSVSMGYGVPPRFWLEFANGSGVDVQVISSRYYEYRYHVSIFKR